LFFKEWAVLGNRNLQYTILAGSLTVLLLLLGWQFFPRAKVSAPEGLAAVALSDADEDQREQAALQLSRHPEQPLAEMRQVFRQSSSPRVKAAAAEGLGALRDWDSVPLLLAAMDDSSEWLRGRAAQAVRRIAVDPLFAFRPDAPPPQRRRVIELIRERVAVLHEGYLVKERLKAAGEQPKPKPKKRPPNA